jgi:hypothetical protein
MTHGTVVSGHRPDDARDDVARLLDDDPVALANVLASDVIGVVERGHRDRGPGHGHRLEHREGRHGARPPHVDGDADEPRDLTLGRKLEGDGPPGELAGGPEEPALGEVVDLDHDAVGLEIECPALHGPLVAERDDRRNAVTDARVRLDRKAPRAELVERRLVSGRTGKRDGLIEVRAQAPLGDERRIEVAERAGGGVARIGEERFALVLTVAVEANERGARKEDFAADLDRASRCAGETQRHASNRSHVGGHVLPREAVAPGRRACQ